MLSLAMIQVTVSARRHDNPVVQLCSRYSAGFPSPAHHRCIRRQPAFQDLIPSDNIPSMRVEEFFHPVNKIALQLILIFEVQFLHQALAESGAFPGCFRRFISPDMDIVTGKKRHDFLQHVFIKIKGVIRWAEDSVIYSPPGSYPMCSGLTGQPGIGGDSRGGMTGHFNFRDYGDIPVLRVFYNFPDLRLRVITAAAMMIEFPGLAAIASDKGGISPGADL